MTTEISDLTMISLPDIPEEEAGVESRAELVREQMAIYDQRAIVVFDRSLGHYVGGIFHFAPDILKGRFKLEVKPGEFPTFWYKDVERLYIAGYKTPPNFLLDITDNEGIAQRGNN